MKFRRELPGAVAVVAAMSQGAGAQQVIWHVEAAKPEDSLNSLNVGPDDDGDGIADLLLGYMGEVCSATSLGVVRKFSTTSGQFAQWCGMSATGGFGYPVRWVDDIDGGGRADVVVGETSYDEPTIGSRVGRLQAYSSETGVLLYEVMGTQDNGHFGAFTAGGDFDGDGISELIVGSGSYGPNGEGQVWVLSGATGAEIRAHYGTSIDMQLGDFITGLGDVDGDGIDDYAASAVGEFVDVYSGGTGATIRRLLPAPNDSNFGIWLGRCSDLDGDGLGDILISRVGTRTGGPGDGWVEVWSPMSGNLLWSVNGLTTDEYFGRPAFEVGDQNADGIRDYVITAPYADHENRDSGRVDLISGATRRVLYRFHPNAKQVSNYGQLLTRGADFNGDGIEDLVMGTNDGGTLSKQAGLVQIRAGNDLWLQAEPIAPVVGDTVIVDLRGAPAGQLGLIALTAIDSAPTFATLLLAPFDANGELQLSADIDASLSGMEFTLMGWAQNKNGRGPLVDATPFVVTVQ